MTKLEQNAQPESNLNLNDVVDGKTLSEWVMSDHGLVDYSKLKFGHNVSNTKGRVIFDLGEYEFDPDVRETVYQNGVDLARVAACARYHTEYKGMRFKTAIDGWDHMMSFLHGYRNATISDYVIYFSRSWTAISTSAKPATMSLCRVERVPLRRSGPQPLMRWGKSGPDAGATGIEHGIFSGSKMSSQLPFRLI